MCKRIERIESEYSFALAASLSSGWAAQFIPCLSQPVGRKACLDTDVMTG